MAIELLQPLSILGFEYVGDPNENWALKLPWVRISLSYAEDEYFIKIAYLGNERSIVAAEQKDVLHFLLDFLPNDIDRMDVEMGKLARNIDAASLLAEQNDDKRGAVRKV